LLGFVDVPVAHAMFHVFDAAGNLEGTPITGTVPISINTATMTPNLCVCAGKIINVCV
jgi:hypothetical protein